MRQSVQSDHLMQARRWCAPLYVYRNEMYFEQKILMPLLRIEHATLLHGLHVHYHLDLQSVKLNKYIVYYPFHDVQTHMTSCHLYAKATTKPLSAAILSCRRFCVCCVFIDCLDLACYELGLVMFFIHRFLLELFLCVRSYKWCREGMQCCKKWARVKQQGNAAGTEWSRKRVLQEVSDTGT
jgi:hypothetical protein